MSTVNESSTVESKPKVNFDKYIPFAEKACDYLSASPDPYHAVLNSVTKLEAAGYVRLSKREPFLGKIKPGMFTDISLSSFAHLSSFYLSLNC